MKRKETIVLLLKLLDHPQFIQFLSKLPIMRKAAQKSAQVAIRYDIKLQENTLPKFISYLSHVPIIRTLAQATAQKAFQLEQKIRENPEYAKTLDAIMKNKQGRIKD